MRALLLAALLSFPMAASADVCNRVLDGPTRYAMHNVSGTLATGDFDLDGRPDVAFPYVSSSIVAFYWNHDGGLMAGKELAVPGGVYLVRSTDVDGDGKTEILVIGNTATVIFAEGNGAFRLVSSPAVTSTTSSLARWGDFTGDGVLDILAISGSSGSTMVPYAGQHDGSFQRLGTATLPFPARPGLADIDGDHKADAWTFQTTKITWSRSNGDGTFGAEQTLFNVTASPAGTGDFDGDGRADFAFNGAMFLSSKNWAQGPVYYIPTGSPSLIDADGDGKTDIVSAMAVDRSRGDGTFERFPIPFAEQFANAAAVDLDLDGDRDLVTTSDPGNTPWYDVVVRYNRGNLVYDGGTSLVEPVDFLPFRMTDNFIAGDLTGDGRDEILTDRRDLYVAQADGTYRQLGQVSNTPGIVADFTGDGKADVIAGALLPGRGDGTFDAAIPLPNGWGDVAVDMNNDGKLDMVGTREGAIVQYLNDGSGHFTRTTLATPANLSFQPVQVANFDGDAIPDIVAMTSKNSVATLYLFPGRSPAAAVPLVSNVSSLQGSWWVGDLDGDGDGDVVAHDDADTYDLLVYRGNGSGALWLSQSIQLFSIRRTTISVADFGGDSGLDIAAGSDSEVTSAVWIQESGTFVERHRFPTDLIRRVGSANIDAQKHAALLVLDDDRRISVFPSRCEQTLPAPPPRVTLRQSDATTAPGESYTFTAELSDPTAEGTIRFRRTNVTHPFQDLGKATVVDGRATLTLQSSSASSFGVYALYEGHGRDARSESNRLEHVVKTATPTRRRGARP
jgi:hypothetical protein